MGADYRNFKTPFYEISVSDSFGNRSVKLPHHILRLVEKIEIIETFVAGNFTTFNIDFIEGSREPASPDISLGTEGLYKISTDGQKADMNIAGSITNRSGAITDLRFSGTGGITFLTETERKNGKIDRRPQENVNGEIITRAYDYEPSTPKFLFQARNKISITWGYVEDLKSRRTITGYIYMLKTSFPENGATRTTITCQDTRAALDQVASTTGIPFGTRITSPKGNSIVTFKDTNTAKMIRDICDKAGMSHLVSENLPGDVTDKDKQKLWIGGESFHQFMTRLAALHNSYYSVIPGQGNKKDTLVFIKKQDFESKLVITDRELTAYKGPGSIIKSVDINCDFGVPVGNMQSNIDAEGRPQGEIIKTVSSTQFKSSAGKPEQIISSDPTTQDNPVLPAKMLSDVVAGGKTAGNVDLNPSSSKDRLKSQAENEADVKSRVITLEFVSLGYTKYSPGVIEFRNLGVRYSGKYRLQTATHTIDSSGYVTKGTAISMAVAAGGVSAQDLQKIEDPPNKVDVIQFKSSEDAKKTSTNKTQKVSIIEDYHKLIGIS